MGILVLLLFASTVIFIRYWLAPWVRKKKDKPITVKVPKKGASKIIDLITQQQYKTIERPIALLHLEIKKVHFWETIAMVSITVIEWMLAKNVFACILYAFMGRMIVHMVITLKAARLEMLQANQTQQFTQGIADFLGTGENMISSVTSAAQQLKNPLRDYVIKAIAGAHGNKKLSESIADLAQEIKNPTFERLGSIIGKGMEEGQETIKFAFIALDEQLQTEERVALQRANIIGSYLIWMAIIFASGTLTVFVERMFFPSLWDKIVQMQWVYLSGAVIDLVLAFGLKRYTRMYSERSGVI
ncbi:hypothetical protein [Desulfitobacterium sp. AusDCA]|uniref:hypothetical protein n=1 Tax=Desulfitobacterium sp. AusDCA TaxID=3240383 RepID=UPI003DA7163C